MSATPCEAQALDKHLQRASPQFIAPTCIQWPYPIIHYNANKLAGTPVACHLLEVRSPSKRNSPSHAIAVCLCGALDGSIRQQRRRVVQSKSGKGGSQIANSSVSS